MNIKVGDVLYSRDYNIRQGSWTAHSIVGETPQSWLIKTRWYKRKVIKKDLTAAPENPKHTSQRTQFYTEDGKRQYAFESDWMLKFGEPTKRAIQHRCGFSVLQKVHDLLVAEGVLKEQP